MERDDLYNAIFIIYHLLNKVGWTKDIELTTLELIMIVSKLHLPFYK